MMYLQQQAQYLTHSEFIINIWNLPGWALPGEGVHLWDFDGPCTPSSQRDLSPSLQRICWGLCCLALSPGLVTIEAEACQSDGDSDLPTVLTVCVCVSPSVRSGISDVYWYVHCLSFEVHVSAPWHFRTHWLCRVVRGVRLPSDHRLWRILSSLGFVFSDSFIFFSFWGWEEPTIAPPASGLGSHT